MNDPIQFSEQGGYLSSTTKGTHNGDEKKNLGHTAQPTRQNTISFRVLFLEYEEYTFRYPLEQHLTRTSSFQFLHKMFFFRNFFGTLIISILLR